MIDYPFLYLVISCNTLADTTSYDMAHLQMHSLFFNQNYFANQS